MTARDPGSVLVVIVNWNGAAHLPECLDGLRRQTIADRMRVVVVDNGSTDASLEVLERYRDVAEVVRNDRNVGFAAGANQGIARDPGAAFVALLNNDAVPEPDWLVELVAALATDPRAGFATPKVVDHADPDVLDNAGHVLFGDGLTVARGRGEPASRFDHPAEVFGPSGCAPLLRRAMLDEIGPFDEAFFAYCEDGDLAWRARLAGWTCRYVPEAVVRHKLSATAGSASPFKALHVERNRVWLAVKNLPLPLLVLSVPFTLARYGWQAAAAMSGRGASGEFATSGGKLALAAILARAWWEAMLGMPRVIRQRRTIQARRTASIRQILGWRRRFGVSARGIAYQE